MGLGIVKPLLVAALLILSIAALSGTVVSLDVAGDEHTTLSGSIPFAQENNSTVRHEDPDRVNQRGDLENVEGWLAGQLTERLSRSSIQLSQGQYDAARQMVGEDFRERYGQYVDVAGETGDDSAASTEPAEQFESAQENQQAYTDSVQDYRETYDQYRDAKANGNQTQARTLARELERHSQSVNERGDALSQNYEAISNRTDANLSESQRLIQDITQNITDDQLEVRNETFIRTDLTVTARTANVSFTNPLVAQGRLTTENGSTIADRTITFSLADRPLRTRTNETGHFTLTYRPTTLSTNTTTATLRYLPVNESAFLGSNETLSLSVSQVTPTVRITDHTSEVAYNDTLRVRGSVGVDQTGAPAVPVDISLGGEHLATSQTNENGTFTATLTVPATIPSGTVDLRASLPLRNQALAPANATADLTVRETETNLTMAGTQSDSSTAQFSGRLVTANGDPIANQRVTITADETALASVQTNGNGRFETTATVPRHLRDDEETTISVAARFDGAGTNLESAHTLTSLTLSPLGQSQSSIPTVADRVPMWAILVVALGIGTLVIFAWRRRGVGGPVESDESDVSSPSVASNQTSSTPPSELSPTLLSLARSKLSDGKPDEAVQTAYAAVRRQLVSRFDSGTAYTHWELYHACQEDGLSEDQLDTLWKLTQTYERAAFDSERVSRDTAATIFDALAVFDVQKRDP